MLNQFLHLKMDFEQQKIAIHVNLYPKKSHFVEQLANPFLNHKLLIYVT
jgi:hypothetical protein